MAYGMRDMVLHLHLIEKSEADAEYKQVLRRKMDSLLAICETTGCRRQSLLAYFGQQLPEPCGNCDTCLEPVTGWDATVAVQKALSAMVRTGGWFGSKHVIEVLRGELSDKVKERGHEKLPTFGAGKDIDAKGWSSILRQILAQGLALPPVDRPWSLVPTDAGRAVLKGERTVTMREDPSGKTKIRASKSSRGGIVAGGLDPQAALLFESLRRKRSELAKEQGVPAFIIFNDATLLDMARKAPTTTAEFRDVDGIGPLKAERYGKIFLDVIRFPE
jgi:ATP-dependent DNA helicase RecQ